MNDSKRGYSSGACDVQWLARVCVERPVFALMLILAVVVAGVTSYQQLGIDRFPNIDLPMVRVQTIYPGAASAEVESEVTQPLEDAVATVAGLDELRSVSNDGVSMLFLTFRLDQNINVAAQDVRDAVSSVLNRLPPDIDPPPNPDDEPRENWPPPYWPW